MKIVRGGTEIRTLEEWHAAMPPRLKGRQWKEGRSAMELARAWVATGRVAVPDEVRRLLESNTEFSSVRLLEGKPEAEVRLEDFRGNTRNADLLLVGERAGERVVISVEAKADESFGPRIGEHLAEKEKVPASKAPARIRLLSSAIFGVGPEEVAHLRYQLLHGVAGALIAAREEGAGRALFLIHEFPAAGDRNRLEKNEADLTELVRRLGWDGEFGAGRIAGPWKVPGGGRVPSDVELFIGKVERHG